MRNSKKIILSSVIASLLLVGCGDDSSSPATTTPDITNETRFTTMVMDTETLEVDNVKKVEWVGSAGKNMNACVPHGAATTEMSDIASVKAHCEQLVFASHDDWRVATPAEQQEHITEMNTAGKTPFYANPACPRVIGVEGTEAKAVNTHNSMPIGSLTKWTDLIDSTPSNFGVKCVRDIK